MSKNIKDRPIGFFDSGLGGLSVMKKAIEDMPEEEFIYLGDSANAPYGIKENVEIKRLTLNGIEFLIDKGVKGIVVACNTATSVAIEDLRMKYKDIPVIGIEPALKPAVELKRDGKIIIMATNATLKEKKFEKLMGKYAQDNVIVPLPCPGLVEYIENGILEGKEIDDFLRNLLKEHISSKIGSIVLGCTHYPFVKKAISNIVGPEVAIIDGSKGTSRELKRQLIEMDLVSDRTNRGNIEIFNTLGKDKIDLSFSLINIK
ncbi:glutamate racemase [Clostridium sp. UBA1652]|uniref:glutamate racemase n=1 Tax=Clostridium sp. UBA1652 TaxID=1946348 RepID=UPI00257E0093|nr:glutamate racemase [Clostridium sp. UBA1652]